MALVFYDWEFYEDGKTIEPISLGMVSESGTELYVVNQDFDWDKCLNNWLHENVKPKINLINDTKVPKNKIGEILRTWLRPSQSKVELVGYYADYDHVCLAQQFGTMMDLPDNISMYTRDLKQWCDDLGNPKLPEQQSGEHNALLDARWNKDIYYWLVNNYEHPAWTPRLRKPKLKTFDML